MPSKCIGEKINNTETSFERGSIRASDSNLANHNIRTIKSEIQQNRENSQSSLKRSNGGSDPNIFKEQTNEEYGETTRRRLEFAAGKNSNPETSIPKSNYRKNNLKV